MLKQILLVGLGGGVGSVLRFLTSEITHKYYSEPFPLATFIINILGCFCIGMLVNLIPVQNQTLKLLLMVGFCGGYTTFSTFARESFDLIQNNQTGIAFLYTLASCIVGVCAVWLGILATK